MPILFPSGFNTDSAVVEDFSMFFENLKKITERSKKNTNFLETHWSPTLSSYGNNISNFDLDFKNEDINLKRVGKVSPHRFQYFWKLGDSFSRRSISEVRDKPFYWKNFLIKFRDFEFNRKLGRYSSVGNFKSNSLSKTKNIKKIINTKNSIIKNSQYVGVNYTNYIFLDLFYKNVLNRSKVGDDFAYYNLPRESEYFTKSNLFTDNLVSDNTVSSLNDKENNFEQLDNASLSSRKNLYSQKTLDINRSNYKAFNASTGGGPYRNDFDINTTSKDIGYTPLNLDPIYPNSGDVYSGINTDLYIKSEFQNDILANSVAFEINLEYSNLFEALIMGLTNSNSRTDHLDYEFENTNQMLDTLTEWGDVDGNFNESGQIENDSVIDDPRTETIPEMPYNDIFRNQLINYGFNLEKYPMYHKIKSYGFNKTYSLKKTALNFKIPKFFPRKGYTTPANKKYHKKENFSPNEGNSFLTDFGGFLGIEHYNRVPLFSRYFWRDLGHGRRRSKSKKNKISKNRFDNYRGSNFTKTKDRVGGSFETGILANDDYYGELNGGPQNPNDYYRDNLTEDSAGRKNISSDSSDAGRGFINKKKVENQST